MRPLISLRLSLSILVFLSCSDVHAADDTLALCTLCHGTNANGNPSVRAPKLSGLDRAYLLRQVQAFRSGARGTHERDVGGSEMCTIALSLREAEITKLIQTIADLKGSPAPITVQGNATRGQTLYSTCAACHGQQGEGNLALNAPALAKGSDWYWVAQLTNYRNGLRGIGADTIGAPMRAMAASLPDEQAVLDVVAYINTLR
jgi:cytochrome c oxidase subunit 2